ncbi:MAG: leucine-rich repeat domain-containing protein [Culicoidibacterales bacterium]
MKMKSNIVKAHVLAHVLALILSPLLRRKPNHIQYRFEGYCAIDKLFPDHVLAQAVAQKLHKSVTDEILFEALLSIKQICIVPLKNQVDANVTDLSGIGYLGALKQLKIHDGSFAVIPEEIAYLTQLESLDFTSGKLTEIPSAIYHLEFLSELSIRNQNITNINSEIKQSKMLRKLNLSDNKLAYLPAEVGLMESLTHLYLQNNPLTSLPRSIIYLRELSVLDISYTLIDKLPAYNQIPPKLRLLNLNKSNITVMDDDFFDKTSDQLKIIGEQLVISEEQVEILSHKQSKKPKKNKSLGILSVTVATIVVVGAIFFRKRTR